ncbi:MAG: MgtC/SapB family protein [bacterium]|nr:MAG: MgtC/SapB family protein [bacterium]
MDLFSPSILLNLIKLWVTTLAVLMIGWSRPEEEKFQYLLSLVFVGIGSCLFMIVTVELAPYFVIQPQHIAGNVMLGMLVLGMIIIIKNKVSGTSILSAASIWLSGATGLAIGIGLFMEGIAMAFISFLTFKWLSRLVKE